MAALELLLLRHGEAEKPHGRSDHGRALTRRGTADAARVGELLAAGAVRPSLVLTSDARRARETAAQVLAAFGGQLPLVEDGRLYLAGLSAIAVVTEGLGAASHPVLLLVGHNPGFSDAATALCGADLELSTAEAAHLTVEAGSWVEALQLNGVWELKRVWRS